MYHRKEIEKKLLIYLSSAAVFFLSPIDKHETCFSNSRIRIQRERFSCNYRSDTSGQIPIINSMILNSLEK